MEEKKVFIYALRFYPGLPQECWEGWAITEDGDIEDWQKSEDEEEVRNSLRVKKHNGYKKIFLESDPKNNLGLIYPDKETEEQMREALRKNSRK